MSALPGFEEVLGKDRDGNDIIITGDYKCISVEEFQKRFGGDYRFDSIMNHENCTPMWKKIFEEWKHRGILK